MLDVTCYMVILVSMFVTSHRCAQSYLVVVTTVRCLAFTGTHDALLLLLFAVD